jgi:preprotein translocase subunit Sss1
MDRIDKDHNVEERLKKLGIIANYIRDWNELLEMCKFWSKPVKDYYLHLFSIIPLGLVFTCDFFPLDVD